MHGSHSYFREAFLDIKLQSYATKRRDAPDCEIVMRVGVNVLWSNVSVVFASYNYVSGAFAGLVLLRRWFDGGTIHRAQVLLHKKEKKQMWSVVECCMCCMQVDQE